MDTTSLIRNHLDAMLDNKLAEEIGATKESPLHMRVLRVLDALNEARAENAKLREVLSAIANDPHAMALNRQAASNALNH